MSFKGMKKVQFKAEILDEAGVRRALRRMSFEVLERNKGCENLCLVGIRRRGVPLAQMMAENILQSEGERIPTGELDIGLYRDDIDPRTAEASVKSIDLGFEVAGKHIVLVDDVLYTGRTVRAAIDALISLGRPASVQLAILCDRGHRELPIRADYIGKNIPTAKQDRVVVNVLPYDGKMCVELYGEGN